MRVVVIGGGIIGATIAHELAKEGADVTLLEQRYYTYGTTGRSTGSITTQQKEESLVRHALRTISIWKKFKEDAKELGIPFAARFMDDESPHVAVALTEEELQKLDQLAKTWGAGGSEVIKADPLELGNYLPGFNSEAVAGAYITPKDYKAMPHPYTWARIAAARLSGAKTLPYTRAVKISKDNGTLKVVTTDQEIQQADTVVIAGGAASKELLMQLNPSVGKHIYANYGAGFVTEPFKYEMKATLRVISESYRLLQTPRNEYVVTIDDMGIPNPQLSTDDSLEFLVRASKLTVKLMPRFEYVNVLRSWGAYIDKTTDGLPLVGWDPEFHGAIYYLVGFNDYGLSVGPSVADLASKEILSGVKEPSLDKYRVTRFF